MVEDLWKRKVHSEKVPDRKLADQDGGGPRRICPAVLACIWGRNIEHLVFASFCGIQIKYDAHWAYIYLGKSVKELRIICCDQVKDASRVKAVGVTWLSAHDQSLFDYSINEQDMWEGNWGSIKRTCVSNVLLPWQDHISLLVATHRLLTISRFPQRFPQRWISLASNVQRPISLSLVLCPNVAQCPQSTSHISPSREWQIWDLGIVRTRVQSDKSDLPTSVLSLVSGFGLTGVAQCLLLLSRWTCLVTLPFLQTLSRARSPSAT